MKSRVGTPPPPCGQRLAVQMTAILKRKIGEAITVKTRPTQKALIVTSRMWGTFLTCQCL